MFSEGSKSRLAKAADAEPSGRMRKQKIARGCGAKDTSESKCAEQFRFGALLNVEPLKKCMWLWRQGHFEVKMRKAHQLRRAFGT